MYIKKIKNEESAFLKKMENTGVQKKLWHKTSKGLKTEKYDIMAELLL